MFSVYSVQYILITNTEVHKSITLNNGTLVRRT